MTRIIKYHKSILKYVAKVKVNFNVQIGTGKNYENYEKDSESVTKYTVTSETVNDATDRFTASKSAAQKP